jgi:hypothetical protein
MEYTVLRLLIWYTKKIYIYLNLSSLSLSPQHPHPSPPPRYFLSKENFSVNFVDIRPRTNTSNNNTQMFVTYSTIQWSHMKDSDSVRAKWQSRFTIHDHRVSYHTWRRTIKMRPEEKVSGQNCIIIMLFNFTYITDWPLDIKCLRS